MVSYCTASERTIRRKESEILPPDTRSPRVIRLLGLLLGACLVLITVVGASPQTTAKNTPAKAASKKTPVKKTPVAKAAVAKPKPAPRRRASSPWKEPTYADSTEGDHIDGEDLVVRRAAVEALGPYNGSVVVVDPASGRVLTIVNQKVAFSSGFQPCSTIKVVAALAALSESLVDRNTLIRLYGRTKMDMTEALAHSNNVYFANLGQKLGFDRVLYYARLFGLGERAGFAISDEQAGLLPDAPPRDGGVGMMTSFGSGISVTPLELAALMSAVANGGTLYYLQYPRNEEEIAGFVPRVKRQLDIESFIPEIKPGMMAAVEYGTARRANFDPNEPVYAKTGTCTDSRTPTHLGWFGSFNDTGKSKLVVVVLLTGGKTASGALASAVGGSVYKTLSRENYFAQTRPTISPAALVSTRNCCYK